MKTNIAENQTAQNNKEAERPTLDKRLKLLHPFKAQRSRSKSPARTKSKTDHHDRKQENEITELKNEIALLKQRIPTTKATEIQTNPSDSKNSKAASQAGGQEKQNKDIINVITFIQRTMETLTEYTKQLSSQLNINMTRQEMS